MAAFHPGGIVLDGVRVRRTTLWTSFIYRRCKQHGRVLDVECRLVAAEFECARSTVESAAKLVREGRTGAPAPTRRHEICMVVVIHRGNRRIEGSRVRPVNNLAIPEIAAREAVVGGKVIVDLSRGVVAGHVAPR